MYNGQGPAAEGVAHKIIYVNMGLIFSKILEKMYVQGTIFVSMFSFFREMLNTYSWNIFTKMRIEND